MMGARQIADPRWAAWGLVVGAWGAVACGSTARDENPFDAATAAAGTSAAATSGGGGEGPVSGGDAGSAAGDDSGGIKLDVGGGQPTADDGGDADGCDKVDFLFIVDNSGSMQDEQQSLVASFPGFISTIQDTLMAQDYHIAVVDTDAESLSFGSLTCINGVCSCEPEPQCCYAMCDPSGPIQPAPTECGGLPCREWEVQTGCPVVLGAGKAEDPVGNSCDIVGDLRYMTDQQPDLPGTFECAALVGAGGDGNERPMEAMMQAVSAETSAGGCHEGFVRDDAILVVTFISDEEDEGSTGMPASWKQALVDAKNGNEDAIVVLGLLGDSGVAGGVCNGDQAEDAPKLRTFAESFAHGAWGSVCSASYTSFFEDAVSVIDTTCDEFVPEG